MSLQRGGPIRSSGDTGHKRAAEILTSDNFRFAKSRDNGQERSSLEG
jgi:hypothetical protein